MTAVKSERKVQNRIIKLLEHHHNYTYIGNLHDTENRCVITDILRKFLVSKQGCTDSQATEAINELTNVAFNCPSFDSISSVNAEVYSKLRFPVKVSQGAGKTQKSVYLIDWKNPANNLLHIAEEVTVRKELSADEHRRPDVVIYINGIAVAIIELKKATVSVQDGIRQQWRNQGDGQICSFFSTSQLLLAGSESEGVFYGTTLTPPKFYLHWREPVGESYPDGGKEPTPVVSRFTPSQFPNELDRSLLQLLEPERLIEIMNNLIVFDGGVKKVCRPNQYFALQAAKRRVLDRNSGIVWHSQGSGKSLTMVWLAQWILENIAESRIVIITDRDELDKQITNGFKAANKQPFRAGSGEELLNYLAGKTDEKHPIKADIICTLIHKFGLSASDSQSSVENKLKGKRSPELYLKDLADNLAKKHPDFHAYGHLFVFVDECHRTQGGVLHKAMRQILGEDIMFIGFTGTPLLKVDKEKLTSSQCFGSWIHTYKFNEAVEDGVVLDLRYEARSVDQHIEDDDKQTMDTLFDARTKGLPASVKDALLKRWANMQNIFSSKDRIDRIRKSITNDFITVPCLRDGWGNAMLVANSIYEAFRFWKSFQETELASHCAVISSYDGSEASLSEGYGSELKTEHEFKQKMMKEMLHLHSDRTPEEFETWAKAEFVDHPASMKLLIVVDKLLTGFDAPAATYLYIDKEMRDHNLFQAICRVNRTNGERKMFGQIIDYKNLFDNIQNSISDYTKGAFSGYDPTDVSGLIKGSIEEGKKALDDARAHCRRLDAEVMPPKDIDCYFAFFCYDPDVQHDDAAMQQQIKKNTQNRHSFYKAVVGYIRCYSNISLQMTEAGYTEQDAADIYKEITDYNNIVKALMLRAHETFELSSFDAEMRALLDDYVQARRIDKLGELGDDFSFLSLIKTDENGEATSDEEEEKELGGKDGVAETIASHTRSIIIRGLLKDPKYYENLSKRLQTLIENYHAQILEYKKYLAEIKILAEEIQKGQKVDPRLDTEGKVALYNNLGNNVEFALDIDKVIRANAQKDFRKVPNRGKKLKLAIIAALDGKIDNHVTVANEIYDIVVNHLEY